MIDKETRDKLRAPFPDEAISQHPTKTFLSTIKAIYIAERLNDIFGIGGWIIETEIVSDTPDYVAMKGRLEILGQSGFTTSWQYGGHGKTGKNTEPADGYKSAVTDCLSKCASYLEIGIDVFKGKVTPPGGGGSNKKSAPSGGQSRGSDKPKPKNPDAPITDKQRDLLWKKMQFKKLDDDASKAFYSAVLDLSSKKIPSIEWASDFIDEFDNYFDIWKASTEIN